MKTGYRPSEPSTTVKVFSVLGILGAIVLLIVVALSLSMP